MRDKNHNLTEHYNIMIWTVFSVGVAFSLLILYKIWTFKASFGAMQFFMGILGFLTLFYCILAIESFGQKKSLGYKVLGKKNNLKNKIKELPYCRIDWLAELILFFLVLAYVYMFWFIRNNNSLAEFGNKIIFLELPVFIGAVILSAIIIFNWILRPKSGDGNIIERLRIFIFGNWLKNYDEIAKGDKNDRAR